MTKKSSNNLKLAPLDSFDLIPYYLLKQVKGRNWEPNKLYEWGQVIGSQAGQLIYAIITPEQNIKGVVWASVNPMINGIFLNIVSVDPEYQDGIILEKITNTLKQKTKELGLSTVYALTSRPKAAEHRGWDKTKQILMEA